MKLPITENQGLPVLTTPDYSDIISFISNIKHPRSKDFAKVRDALREIAKSSPENRFLNKAIISAMNGIMLPDRSLMTMIAKQLSNMADTFSIKRLLIDSGVCFEEKPPVILVNDSFTTLKKALQRAKFSISKEKGYYKVVGPATFFIVEDKQLVLTEKEPFVLSENEKMYLLAHRLEAAPDFISVYIDAESSLKISEVHEQIEKFLYSIGKPIKKAVPDKLKPIMLEETRIFKNEHAICLIFTESDRVWSLEMNKIAFIQFKPIKRILEALKCQVLTSNRVDRSTQNFLESNKVTASKKDMFTKVLYKESWMFYRSWQRFLRALEQYLPENPI